MKPITLLVICLMLSGCEKAQEAFFKFFSGTGKSTLVLASNSTQLSPTKVKYELSKPAIAIGGHSAVCFSLAGGISLETNTREQIDEIFSQLLGDAELFATLESVGGETFELSNPGQAWSRYGEIEARDELSACINAACCSKIPKGTKIQTVQVYASKPISVRGIYWLSLEDIN